jgi:hypothetical protein
MSSVKIRQVYIEYRDMSVREFGYDSFVKALSQFVTRNADLGDIAIASQLAYRYLTEQRQHDYII